MTEETNNHIYPVWGLLFFSGFTSLVYQVLWMRELVLLFGSSAYATSGTIAVFFTGLAIGSAIWSRRAPLTPKPLKEYGILEIGIGFSGILYFGLLPLYSNLYSPLYELLGSSIGLLLAAKLLLATLVLLPPSILMGGTLPLVCQQMVNGQNKLGRIGPIVYGINTLGAASGALAAGFWLPAWFGFKNTYLLAVIVSVAIGVIAWFIGRQIHAEQKIQPEKHTEDAQSKPCPEQSVSVPRVKLFTIAFVSGALVLALEVLWTRMFQQVLQNSVYTFSIILVTFLAALAVGAFLSSKLVILKTKPKKVILLLLIASSLASLISPFLFYQITDGMRYLGSGEAWSTYLVSIFSAALIVLFIPGVAIGCVFPYLFRIAERTGEPGKVVGQLSAINTAGAIIGSLIAGFLLLNTIGLWNSIFLVALLYLLLAALIWFPLSVTLASAACLALGITFLNSAPLPGVRLNSDTEVLLGHWEGPDGYVAVIEREGSKRIKINNFYALGSTAAFEHEQNLSLIHI